MVHGSRTAFGFATFIVLFAGCGEPTVEGGGPTFVPRFDVEVTPDRLDFGSQPVDAIVRQELLVSNRGNVEAFLSDIAFPPGVSLRGLVDEPLIAPGDQANVVVEWRVTKPAILEGKAKLMIGDSPGESDAFPVKLAGSGQGATFALSVSEHDFGTLPLGCGDALGVTISNAGNEPLVVDDIDLLGDASFTLVQRENLPIVVPPFGRAEATVRYHADDDQPDSAELSVRTSVGDAHARFTGSGMVEGRESVLFEATPLQPTVVLFFVNESVAPSGEGNRFQAPFEAGLPAMFEELIESKNPFRVAFIGSNTGTVLGDDFIDDETSLTVAVDTAIFQASAADAAGDNDRMSESLLNAISQNKRWVFDEDWLSRFPYWDEPKLALVALNDDRDQSTISEAAAVAQARGWVADPNNVVFHGIAGPIAGGTCGATPAASFKVAIDLTGGTLNDICAPSYESAMRDIVRGTVPPAFGNDRVLIPLKGTPLPRSIRITVDGQNLPTGWHFDPAENAVIIESDFALPGVEIRLTYNTANTCG